MPLKRSRSQGDRDLAECYQVQEGDTESVRRWMAAMRQLIHALDKALPETDVWGLTSHFSLGLMSVPQYDAGEKHVWIEHFSDGYFTISYKPPEGTLPIPGSTVTFRAEGVAEAVQRIKFAMAETLGWPDSPDLESKSE